MSDQQHLSLDEERELVALLERMGTTMPPAVFNALAASLVLTAIETVILREREGRLEVLLLRRPADDAHWPGLWHIPGTILRTSDAPQELNVEGSFSTAFQRIERRELRARFTGRPRYAGSYFHRAERGAVHSLLFCCQAEEGGEGTYVPVNALPDTIIPCHRPMIARAVNAYASGQ